jgi:F-type H+-transporting ATPase subunit b
LDFNIDGALFPNIYTLLTQWGATLILYLVFKKYLYTPVVKFLDKRQVRMQEDLEDAKKEREMAQAQHQKAQETYQQAVQTGQQMVDESRKQAETIKSDIVKEAKAQADHKIGMAQSQIDGERKAMLQDVQNEIVEVALAATHRLLEKEIDEESQRDAISQMLAQISQE